MTNEYGLKAIIKLNGRRVFFGWFNTKAERENKIKDLKKTYHADDVFYEKLGK